LEARTRIAADARGITRKIFEGRRRTGDAGSASLAGEENYVFFDDGRASDGGFASGGGDCFFLDALGFGVCTLPDVFVLDQFVVVVLAMCGVVLGVFLSNIRGEFGAVGGASGFDFRGLFFGEFRNWCGRRFFCFLDPFV
jgi:hypothetical protein